MKDNHKFRVWDKFEKIFITNYRNNDYENPEKNSSIWEWIYYFIVNHDFREEENYIFDQFTGLYDKSGREIHENDILLFEADYEEMIDGDGNIIGLVVFTHGHYYFMDNQSDEPLHHFSEKQTEILDLKIIGNIHENKELLN